MRSRACGGWGTLSPAGGGSGFEEGSCVPCPAIQHTLRQDDRLQSVAVWTWESLQPCPPNLAIPYASTPLHSETEPAFQEDTSDVCHAQSVTPGEAVTFTPALWLPKMRFVRGCTSAFSAGLSAFTHVLSSSPVGGRAPACCVWTPHFPVALWRRAPPRDIHDHPVKLGRT